MLSQTDCQLPSIHFCILLHSAQLRTKGRVYSTLHERQEIKVHPHIMGTGENKQSCSVEDGQGAGPVGGREGSVSQVNFSECTLP